MNVTSPFFWVLAIAILSTLISIFLYIRLYKKQSGFHKQQVYIGQLEADIGSLIERRQTLETSEVSYKNEVKSLTTQIHELQSIKGQLEQLQLQSERQLRETQSKELSIEELREKLSARDTTIAELTLALDNEKLVAEEKIELLENAKKQLSDEFKILANQIFEQKQQQFTQTNQASLESVLKPMRGAINEFKTRVEQVHKEDIEGRVSLSEQLKQLHALNSQMSQEAQNLTQALKGDSKTQGNWGELILERLLERSGLTEGIEFEREKSFTNDEGKRLRPDVIINMPDKKHIVIDSKVSLLHYEQALNTDDEGEKSQYLKAHLMSLKKHISALAEKRYEHLEQLNAPDFVLMFLPVEGAYLMAIEADSAVFEDAFEKRVAVVTPTTLFTTLKTIEQLWRYERQSENTVKLIKRAADVHDKFVGFIETFEKIGSQIETVNGSYQKAKNQLVAGNGNLIRQAEMLKDLAGKTKKEIPQHLLEEAEGNRIDNDISH